MNLATGHSSAAIDDILRQPDGLRVEVSDGCPSPPRPAPDSGELSEGGRGLLLVEAVTDRWGTDANSTGKTVWFEYDAPPPATSGSARARRLPPPGL